MKQLIINSRKYGLISINAIPVSVVVAYNNILYFIIIYNVLLSSLPNPVPCELRQRV